ncbi:hydrolase, NUDIX family [Acanthamoeba castellanii str. Neff]|uniref:Hydrolase, NUDIX family n=1 Tax=Acanthamoeba castellanii (strain ATCC 30010 / Neff) TaxID=1257118 RepID=L8GPF6_ACACF|nr:hydrolase, NUDIX family [Acanthamoeba castellanii str. Neff]ELR14875.1 hydrolase, NUDIX family [Acanthamoeba castellanii str. Neff]
MEDTQAQQKSSAKCYVAKEDLVWQGKWLKMKEVHWVDPLGKGHVWESLERTNHRKAPVDAVEVIATLKKTGHPTQLILVRQFRPPTAMYCLELPAGLCDSGEAPEVTAVRELKEETGYTAEIIDVSPSLIAVVNGDLPENDNPPLQNDSGEFTEVVLAPVDGLIPQASGEGIDGKIWLIAQTLRSAHLFSAK